MPQLPCCGWRPMEINIVQETLTAMFYRRAADLGDAVCLRYKEGCSPYRDMSWNEFVRLIREISFGLALQELEKGSRAAIFANTSHLWVAADFAIISVGAVTVPIYPTASKSDIEHILRDSQATLAFVENETLLKQLLPIVNAVPALRRVVLLRPPDDSDSGAHPDKHGGLVIPLEALRQSGRLLMKDEPSLVDRRISAAQSEDLVTIVYTSGTTGAPKGVMLSHENITGVLKDLPEIIPLGIKDVALSYLPLSHVFERVCGEFYWYLYAGICAYAQGVEHLSTNMAETQPTMMLAVPRVLDKIYAKVQAGIERAGPLTRRLIHWALSVGAEVVRAKSERRKPGLWLSAKHKLAQLVVLRKLKNRIGSRLRLVISGGAPARKEVIEFFNAAGLTMVEGYGLTETAAPAAVNSVHWVKPGTAGQALPSVQLRIATDGEVLVKGPGVCKGYFMDSEATGSSFDADGWFHTGDIGSVDRDGFLTIIERKKDLIVNSAGKNIAPQKIEHALKTVPLVSQAVVFGDKRNYPVALLVLDDAAAVEFAQQNGWHFDTLKQLLAGPELNKFLSHEVARRLASLSPHERVKKFSILDSSFSVEAGELTPTFKIKRRVVSEKYAPLINSLYGEEPEASLARSQANSA